MLFAFTFGVNKDVIKIHYHKNVELFYQDLTDVALKYDRCINQSKRHDLVLEMAITGLKNYLLFIAFLYPHSMVDICQIELGKALSQT